MFNPMPTTMSTDKVLLSPLTLAHLNDFYSAGSYPEIWRWSLPDKCTSIKATEDWLIYSQHMADKGEHVPFAIFDKVSGKFVGSTRYCSIKREDKSLEIGFTFITPEFQRSYINTHAKYCLLTHAFEELGAIRVELKVHEDNKKSRDAVTRLGAKLEGIIRNQRILPDGSYRNAVIFSIIDSEWPAVKQHLQEKMVFSYA
ncbi:MAG: GNAT family N-acetyltransferase [Colwellia sp.]|nr:GNAT family N-acetyltransferase [Colwellia sp.]MCW8865146.1 GNAT family N-acetyltransferase [Colwellia sp.]MCW9082495.1 GNAT family N-acetyltransferase [Colwellia sp.]